MHTVACNIALKSTCGPAWLQNSLANLFFLKQGSGHIFEPTYNLTPLSEVETYIKANKHLPEVQSAKEMEDEGIEFEGDEFALTKESGGADVAHD